MKKFLALLLAGVMTVSLVACGDSAVSGNGGEAAVATDGEGTDVAAPAGDAGVLNVSIASEPASLDPALNSAVDGATMLVHLSQVSLSGSSRVTAL